MADLHYLSISEAGRTIRNGDLSPVDLVEALLDRIDRLNPKLDAFLAIAGEQARADALAAQEEIAKGNYRGPMHGIPYGLKDIIDYSKLFSCHSSHESITIHTFLDSFKRLTCMF